MSHETASSCSLFTMVKNHRLLLLAVIALWSILVLPSVIFSQWFTLDVGYLLTTGKLFPGNIWQILSPYDGSGRYYPLYFIYNFTQVRLFGTSIPWYYLVQAVLFCFASLATCALFYKMTHSRVITILLAVLVYLNTPNTENLYTIGKQEPMIYFLFSFALLLMYRALCHPGHNIRAQIGITVLFALACLTKETSIVFLGIFPTILVGGYIGRRWLMLQHDHAFYFKQYRLIFLSLVVGLCIAKLPYALFPDNSVHDIRYSYTAYEITFKLVKENFKFYLFQQPDIFFFGIMATIICLFLITKIRKKTIQLDTVEETNLMFTVGMLAVAWAYFLGMLLWRWPMNYYLMLPGILFKITALYTLHVAMTKDLLSKRQLKNTFRGIGLLILYGIAYWFYVATSQISYSRLYTEVMHKYMAIAPQNSRLIIESYPFYAEQVGNTPLVMGLIANDKHTVSGIADLVNPAVNEPWLMKFLRVTPEDIDANEASLPREGDYLLVMTGNKLATWFLRGVTPYFTEDSILKRDNAYDMELVAEKKIYTPSIFFHVWGSGFAAHPTYLGYKLYKVTSKRPKIVWRHKFPDGWMGKQATLRLYPEYADQIRVTVSTPPDTSPNHFSVYQDNALIHQETLVAGKEYTVDITRNKKHIPNLIRFEVSETFRPKEWFFRHDKRDLGILIRIEPTPATH